MAWFLSPSNRAASALRFRVNEFSGPIPARRAASSLWPQPWAAQARTGAAARPWGMAQNASPWARTISLRPYCHSFIRARKHSRGGGVWVGQAYQSLHVHSQLVDAGDGLFQGDGVCLARLWRCRPEPTQESRRGRAYRGDPFHQLPHGRVKGVEDHGLAQQGQAQEEALARCGLIQSLHFFHELEGGPHGVAGLGPAVQAVQLEDAVEGWVGAHGHAFVSWG